VTADRETTSVYGPGAMCDDCGHFAARHDESGCHGVVFAVGCRLGDGGTEAEPRACPGMLWMGKRWPRPWLPAPDGLTVAAGDTR
jgi:hypothetical protein